MARFAFDSAEKITAEGELAWKDASGKIGGLRFTYLPDGVREQIRAWAAESAARSASTSSKALIAQPFDVAAHAPGGRNNFSATVDVLAAPPPAEAALAELRAHLLPAMGALVASSANASIAAAAKKKADSRPRYKTAITQSMAQYVAQSVSLPGITPAQPLVAGQTARELVGAQPALGTMSAVEEIDGEAPASHSVVAAPAVEAKTVTPRKVVFVPAASARRPLLYSLRPPIYSAPSYSLSMFSPVRNPEVRPARPRSVAVTARTANVAHPLVAVVLTIVLAFLVSVGIFVYVSTSWAGQLLFRWEEEIWSGFYSRSLPPSLKPPGSFSPDTSSLPHR